MTTSQVQCTFEATPFWRDVLDREFPVRCREVETASYRAFLWRHRLGKRWISTPFRDRLALEWTGQKPQALDTQQLLHGSRHHVLLKDVGDLLPSSHHAECRGYLRQEFTNSDVNLDNQVFSRLKHAARKNWRKARNDYGLECAINPPAAFEHFLALYHHTRRRLGVPPYPISFFRRLFDAIGPRGPVVLLAARDNRDAIGYLLCYLHGVEMISAHIAYNYELRHKRTTDFLFISAFKWGHDNGYERYRFGGDYNNQSQLIAAKEKLGAISRRQLDLESTATKTRADNPTGSVRRILRIIPASAFPYTAALTKVYFR
jgi:Acetyltransferase (GNAT) domain